MSAAATLVERMLFETVMYGGLPCRRADVYRDVFDRTGDKRAADLFAFSKPAVGLVPLPYEIFCLIVGDAL